MRKSLLTGILCFALLFANIYACGGGMKTTGDSKKAVATEVTEDDRTYEGEEKYETKKADAESQKEEGSSDGWSLILVNAQNPIPKSWSVSLITDKLSMRDVTRIYRICWMIVVRAGCLL